MTGHDRIRDALVGGQTLIGTFVFEFATTGIGRLAANAGADFVIYDLEHSGLGWETLRMLSASTRSTVAAPLVRVPAAERSAVSRALDLGLAGIMVPMVDSAATAERVVSWAKYPPLGTRGAIFGAAHDDYRSGNPADIMAAANDRTLVIVQIETASGLAEVDAIAAVEGVDVLWLGQFDLTNSLGIPGRFDHADYRHALDRVAQAAQRHGKVAGFMATSGQEATEVADRGYRMLAYSGDLWIYRDALGVGIQDVRRVLRSRER